VLFSDDRIAYYINDNFEPAWMSVRPVPTVNIDFGDGKTITRTLHGNIATHVCTADGNVLDIVPGAYEPNMYYARLEQLALLHRWVTKAADPAERLRTYHVEQQAALALGEEPQILAYQQRLNVADFSKVLRIERPIERVLQLQRPQQQAETKVTDASELADMLAKDTRYNETTRRPKIHAKLAELGMQKPGAITGWLYRDVLDADIEDPYLGLQDLLLADYPFAAEERASAGTIAKQ
jgi:hypothetical protein